MNLEQYGKTTASQVALNYYRSVLSGRPLAKACLLRGRHGVGKTTLIHAIAETYGCDLAETNASMDRDKDSFNRFINSGSTVGDRPRILFFDEADGLTKSQQKRLLALLSEVKCPVFIASNSKLEKELEKECLTVDVQPARGTTSLRLAKMTALGGQVLEHEDDPEERIRQALMGKKVEVPPGDWWMVNTWLLDNSMGAEPMAWDLWQSRYRRVGSDMTKYAQRALQVGLKSVEKPWSLKYRWGGPAKKTPPKSVPKAKDERPPAEKKEAPPPPPTPRSAPASDFF